MNLESGSPAMGAGDVDDDNNDGKRIVAEIVRDENKTELSQCYKIYLNFFVYFSMFAPIGHSPFFPSHSIYLRNATLR
jgi:hypothetical protein